MKQATLLLLLCGLMPLARADRLPLPADAPPAFKTECSSCHLAFPPALMIADDWKRVMANLDKHYGDNADLDDKTRQAIERFLLQHAGKEGKVGAGGTAKPGEPPRITLTSRFKRKHHEVTPGDWAHEKVKRPSNCAACHTQAAEGSFREREIVMPDGRRWEK